MDDLELSARTKSKRKRRNTPSDPEDVISKIMNELQRSRDSMDKELSKYNNSFLQTQREKRQQFIDYCGYRLRNLPSGTRSMVATRLLSSEDFDLEMNFSEMHTSSSKSCLTWSCTDASLSDPSWRTPLQQFAESAAESSSPRGGKLARTTRATSKSSSPAAPPSTSIAEPTNLSNSMALHDVDMDTDEFIEDGENSDDLLSTPHVTDSKEATPKKRNPRDWSKKERDALRGLCSGQSEAQRGPLYTPAFWLSVAAQLPGRTQGACFMKWNQLRGRVYKKRTTARHVVQRTWAPEELVKLKQLRPPPGMQVDWAKIASHFPGRTRQSCESKFRRMWGYPYAYPKTRSEAQSPGMPGTEADKIDGELVQGNLAAH